MLKDKIKMYAKKSLAEIYCVVTDIVIDFSGISLSLPIDKSIPIFLIVLLISKVLEIYISAYMTFKKLC